MRREEGGSPYRHEVRQEQEAIWFCDGGSRHADLKEQVRVQSSVTRRAGSGSQAVVGLQETKRRNATKAGEDKAAHQGKSCAGRHVARRRQLASGNESQGRQHTMVGERTDV